MTDNALATTNTLKNLMRSPEISEKFADVVGSSQAGGFISSVLLAVADSDALKKCHPNSIIGSALRAATLRLSVDPGLGQAYIVPFKDKATLIVGYKGLYQMAMRTGKYRIINVAKVYEGEIITEDRLTGVHRLAGGKKSDKIIGYMLFFRLVNGFEKSFYMTVEEIDDHARQYSKSYRFNDSPWKTNVEDMQRKTVLRLGLSRWGYFDPYDLMAMNTADEQIDIENVTIREEPRHTVDENMAALGYDQPKKKAALPEPQPEPELEQEPEQEQQPVTKEQIKELATSLGVDSRGVDELMHKNNGDLNAVYQQMKVL